ncbi:MAG: hypothetical protein ONB16_09845 [candidate division KSB1 bacterium]|nr:hypothetical protein [candidate division KSB1 bacterium]MDZ7318227.1 hypothetical protein [candidate division KSB1 bacterium]MDZ7341173.1 hypothetical protein [candidate division KSB1 bacterium]
MNFSPVVYEHAARFISRSPWEVSRQADLLFQAHAMAFRYYHHSPIVVGIDIYNLEAEAYGARINEPIGNDIPAISRPICSAAADICRLPVLKPDESGRIPMVISVGEKLKREFPEARVSIPISGPFSIASNLLGLENLLTEMIVDPPAVLAALQHLVVSQLHFCDAVIRHALSMSVFESAATPPLISPAMFRSVALPPLKTMLQHLSQSPAGNTALIMGGDTCTILEDILTTGAQYLICPAETDQEQFMAKMQDYPQVMVRINMNPAILSTGNLQAIFREVDRVLRLAQRRQKVCIGTGILPFEIEPEVVLKIRDYIQQTCTTWR